MDEFLASPYGIAAFLAFDAVAIFLVICITYRWLFKRIFDLLISAVCIIFTSPFLIALCVKGAIAKKKGERETVFDRAEYIGKKGKKITLLSFPEDNFRYLPRLFDVFLGKLSFIGCKPFTEEDCAFLTEVENDRHIARPGLINPLILTGDEDSDYEEMLKSDEKYAWNFGFLKDVKIFFVWLLQKIRGEKDEYLGKTKESTFAQFAKARDREQTEEIQETDKDSL